jgi:hypothetical protein
MKAADDAVILLRQMTRMMHAESDVEVPLTQRQAARLSAASGAVELEADDEPLAAESGDNNASVTTASDLSSRRRRRMLVVMLR